MSEIKFSNLIFEEKNVLAQAQNFQFNNPSKSQLPKVNVPLPNFGTLNLKKDKNYFLNKIKFHENDNSKLDLFFTNTENEIRFSPDLSAADRFELLRKLEEKSKERFKFDAKSGSGTGATIDFDSARPISPEQRAKIELESHYAGAVENDPTVSVRGMKPSNESIEMEKQQSLASLEATYKETLKKINTLDKVYAELVRNPTNLNLGNILAAHSSAKFVKLAEKDVKEADQENIDYEGDYYKELYDQSVDKPQYGPAIKNPGKWRKIPTTKIPD